jgi:hypothetical protein
VTGGVGLVTVGGGVATGGVVAAGVGVGAATGGDGCGRDVGAVGTVRTVGVVGVVGVAGTVGFVGTAGFCFGGTGGVGTCRFFGFVTGSGAVVRTRGITMAGGVARAVTPDRCGTSVGALCTKGTRCRSGRCAVTTYLGAGTVDGTISGEERSGGAGGRGSTAFGPPWSPRKRTAATPTTTAAATSERIISVESSRLRLALPWQSG